MKFTTAIVPAFFWFGSALAQSQQPLSKIPPGCLLHAVNTQDEPADLNTVCGDNATQVQEAIANMCSNENTASAAQAAFIATCGDAGHQVAAYTGPSGGNDGSGSSGQDVTTTTDSQGNVVTQTGSSRPTGTPNAAPVMIQRSSAGYMTAMVAAIAFAAL